MPTLLELLKQRNSLYYNPYVNNQQQGQPIQEEMTQQKPIESQQNINPEIYQQYLKDMQEPEKPKGFFANIKSAINKNPSLLPSLIGGITALTKGNPYLAGAMGEAGNRMQQQEQSNSAQVESEKRSRRADYVKGAVAQQGNLQEAIAKAQQAYELKGLELGQKERESESKRQVDEAKMAQDRELKMAELEQKKQEAASKLAYDKLKEQQAQNQKNINNIPPEVFNREENLRKEYTKNLGNFPVVADSYGRVIESAADPSAAGDLALIFNFMKTQDPASTVRESEFATAQNAGGVDQRTIALFNKIQKGERLSKEQRYDFVKRSTMLYNQAKLQSDSIRSQYSTLADKYGVDKERTLVDFSYKPKKKENKVGRFKIVGVK